ncbi:MAG TPA: hypothetical protein VKE51_18880 [Vicinamibacterales bacterium]|nr:hypothetical protein [Vicinamibacterales bacterium]
MGARFADVRFVVGDRVFIGEIKVTSYLSIDEAFRTALGQLRFYAHMQFESKPGLIALLDRLLDAKRLALAAALGIAVVVEVSEGEFTLLNPEVAVELHPIFGA